MSEGSRIFVGHRALGYVANHVPLVTRYIHSRREHLVVTSVGRVFHTYGCAKLSLLSVSKIHPEEITAITAGTLLNWCHVWLKRHDNLIFMFIFPQMRT